MLDLDALNFAKGEGLVTVVAQDAESGAVLMVAHADREALQRTLDTGEMHYRSRTRASTASPSQSASRVTTCCVFPLVAPLCHKPRVRDR